MASISYLAMDSNHDPVFTANTSLTGVEAVAQAVLTRLNLFYGEWWEDLTNGLPVFQTIVGQLASQRGLAAMTLAVQRVIEGTPYVTAVTSVQVKFTAGQFSFTAVVQTAFGTTTVTNVPGLQAVIGG